jgi:hypothetical protein
VGWTTKESRFDPQQGQEILLFFIASISILGPTQSRIQWVLGTVSLGESRKGMKLATHLHLIPELMVELCLHSPIHIHVIHLIF